MCLCVLSLNRFTLDFIKALANVYSPLKIQTIRKLRHELSETEKAKLFEIIDKLAKKETV